MKPRLAGELPVPPGHLERWEHEEPRHAFLMSLITRKQLSCCRPVASLDSRDRYWSHPGPSVCANIGRLASVMMNNHSSYCTMYGSFYFSLKHKDSRHSGSTYNRVWDSQPPFWFIAMQGTYRTTPCR